MRGLAQASSSISGQRRGACRPDSGSPVWVHGGTAPLRLPHHGGRAGGRAPCGWGPSAHTSTSASWHRWQRRAGLRVLAIETSRISPGQACLLSKFTPSQLREPRTEATGAGCREGGLGPGPPAAQQLREARCSAGSAHLGHALTLLQSGAAGTGSLTRSQRAQR